MWRELALRPPGPCCQHALTMRAFHATLVPGGFPSHTPATAIACSAHQATALEDTANAAKFRAKKKGPKFEIGRTADFEIRKVMNATSVT